MTLGTMPGVLPPRIVYEAARLFLEILPILHAETANARGVLYAFAASPALADRLAAFGTESEADEDDGTAEDDARDLPRAFLDALYAPAPLGGDPVPSWSPPGSVLAEPIADEVARLWPDLVKR